VAKGRSPPLRGHQPSERAGRKVSVLGMMLSVTAGFLYRIRFEEYFMHAQLGQKCVEYKRRTHRLIPKRH